MCLRRCGRVAFGHMLQNRVALCLSLRPVSVRSHSSVNEPKKIRLCSCCFELDFCHSFTLLSLLRLLCCVQLLRASNRSHLQSPGKGLDTGGFVTIILSNLGSHGSMLGWSPSQGPDWYTYQESIALISRNKKCYPPLVPSMQDPRLDCTACVNSDCFTYITLKVYFGISCTILCFCFPAFLAISYTSQRGEQLDASTSLPWFPLQDLCPDGLSLL